MDKYRCTHGKNKYQCRECGNMFCEHGKNKYRCKDCGGSQICEHNRQKDICKDCGGSQICEHNRQKSKCKDCGGSDICKHNKQKDTCKDCGGNKICQHNIIRDGCRKCGGNKYCIHAKQKARCIECGGSQICEHKRDKSLCKECNGSQICEHNKRKAYCIICGGSQICEHKRERSNCKLCNGSQICRHNKRKVYCKQCGGSQLCKSEWCETYGNHKYDGYCLLCFIHLFPDKPVTRNYKTKERAVVDHVLQQFPSDTYTWITDKPIYDGCSKKRPDLFLDLGYQVIIVEIDENQHQDYDCSCENKRLMELSQDINHRPIIFIRFNPDEYQTQDKKFTSCWAYNGMGVCTIKKSKQKEWSNRLLSLCSQIQYWLENRTDKLIEIIHLFYDSSSNI